MKQKVTMELNEMGNADVHFISLVDRGANRIPFRILKAEEGQMINLTTLFTKKKEEAPIHEVSAIAVSKGSDIAAMTEVITQKGFTVHSVVEQADNDLFVVKADADWGVEHQVVKMSEDVVVLVQTQKGFCSYPDSNSFSDNIKSSGFYPGMSSALNTLGDTVYNIMCDASAPPVEDIRKACNDFTEYLVGMASSVPTTAFKFERIAKVDQKAETCADCEGTEEGVACKSCGKEKAKKEEEVSAEVPNTEVATETPVEGEEVPAVTGEEVVAEVPAVEPPVNEPAATLDISDMIEAGLAKVAEGLQTMFTTQLQTVAAKVDSVATEVQAVSQRIEKTEESLNGTIIGGANEDKNTTVTTQKTETTGSVYDTAFKFPGLED